MGGEAEKKEECAHPSYYDITKICLCNGVLSGFDFDL